MRTAAFASTLCVFAAALHAQSPSDTQVKPAPRPLPVMPDVKTIAPVPVKELALDARGTPTAAPQLPAKNPAPAGSLQPARPIDFSQVYFDAPGDGSLWAHGESYKASFDAQGFTYIPFFGSRAPRNFPVAVALESLTVGGETLPIGGAGARSQDGDRVILDRGGVVELYDLDPQGVKQEFVFESLPRTGELVLRLAVDTELAPRTGASGLEFANDLGFVSYSQALVLDAAGRRQTIATEWNDGAIELRVPAEFLAQARFPLSIDPVFATFSVDITAEDDTSPDMAFENTEFIFAVCWERAFSATDHDVWFEEYSVSGTPVAASRQTVDFTTTYWAHPRIASNVIAGQFLVVAAAGDPSGGARIIRGRTVESESPFTRGAQFTISGAESGDKSKPDVGGDPILAGPTYYCVVWTRDFALGDLDVHARLVRADSTLLGGATILIDNSASTFDFNPTVSKSDGPTPFSNQDWNIVWQRGPFIAGDGDIMGAQVHWDGVITTPSFFIQSSSSDDNTPSASPGIDYAGVRHYAVSFRRDFSGDADIYYSILDGSTLHLTNSLSSQENVFNGLLLQDQIQPTAEASDEFFHIAYSEQFSTSTTDYDIWTSSVYYNGTSAVLAEVHTNLAFSVAREGNPQLTTRRSGGLNGSVTLGAAWEQAGGTNLGDIEAATMTVPQGGPVQILCSGDGTSIACPCAAGGIDNGCPNSLFASGARLRSSGNSSVSSDSLVLLGSQMPNATVVYFQGTSSVAPFVIDDGIMCTGGTVIRLGSKLNAGNASQYPGSGDASVSVRGAIPAAAGVTRMYQAFYRNAAAFCTPATSNRTNALRVTWIL